MLSPGARLGNFEIVAPLRAGGMATLYLARRHGAAGFDRPVAIKVIHQHLAQDGDFIEMFLDEARLAARIQDPHVVHVEELGEERGMYFIVMEFVQGRSLAELLRALAKQGRRMSPACAIHIATQVASGLEAAHEAKGPDGRLLGVVHRDVSPQNVLLSFRGHVKLIDFGIAKARGQSHQTAGDALRGKIAYMSPEQAFGKVVDPRTDVYALGVVLWEMLTNYRLFTADSDIALLEAVRSPKTAPPSSVIPTLSRELDAVVLAALETDPARRTPNASELGRRLRSVPEASGVGHHDLAGLIEAVAPDDPGAPWHVAVQGPSTGEKPSVGAMQVGLDTLSVVSNEVSRPDTVATGKTILALEEARDAVTRWRRRTMGIGVFAAAVITLVVMGVVILTTRAATSVSAAPPATTATPTPPPSTTTTVVLTSPAPAPTDVASAAPEPRPTTAPAVPTRITPKRTRPPTPAARDAGAKKSVEIINGVPIIPNNNL